MWASSRLSSLVLFLSGLLEKRAWMMKVCMEKGDEEFCANEPHSATAYSPHSLEACENLADRKGFCEWVSKEEHNHGQFLEVGKG